MTEWLRFYDSCMKLRELEIQFSMSSCSDLSCNICANEIDLADDPNQGCVAAFAKLPNAPATFSNTGSQPSVLCRPLRYMGSL